MHPKFPPPEVHFPSPEVKFHPPEVHFQPPEVEFHRAEVTFHGAEVQVFRAEVNVHPPEVHSQTLEVNANRAKTNFRGPQRRVAAPHVASALGRFFDVAMGRAPGRGWAADRVRRQQQPVGVASPDHRVGVADRAVCANFVIAAGDGQPRACCGTAGGAGDAGVEPRR